MELNLDNSYKNRSTWEEFLLEFLLNKYAHSHLQSTSPSTTTRCVNGLCSL